MLVHWYLSHTNIQHAQWPKDWHCHILLCYCTNITLLIYINTIGYVLTAAIFTIYTKWIIWWYKKNYFREFYNLFASQKLLANLLACSLTTFNKTKFFLRNTKNTRDMKQNMYHLSSEKDKFGKGYIIWK